MICFHLHDFLAKGRESFSWLKIVLKNLISIVIVILWSGFPWRGRVLLLSLLVALQKQTRELKVNNYILCLSNNWKIPKMSSWYRKLFNSRSNIAIIRQQRRITIMCMYFGYGLLTSLKDKNHRKSFHFMYLVNLYMHAWFFQTRA